MRIGVTYDLRADYLAMGMSEEDTAEFDSEVTIEFPYNSYAGAKTIDAAKAMALTGIDLLAKPQLMSDVRTEFAKAPIVAQWREIFAAHGEG